MTIAEVDADWSRAWQRPETLCGGPYVESESATYWRNACESLRAGDTFYRFNVGKMSGGYVAMRDECVVGIFHTWAA